MAHINLPEGVPGILGPMMAYPKTAKPMNELAELLLRQETATFSKADRETIASYVSFLNQCVFCSETHGAVADVYWEQKGKARQLWSKDNWNQIPQKLQSLLGIAQKVQSDARSLTAEDINTAKSLGATETDIHDTVLISAAFCMFNRYVDGLATMAPPRQHPAYEDAGRRLSTVGYRDSIASLTK